MQTPDWWESLPKKVKISYLHFDIRLFDGVDLGRKDFYGECDVEQSEIKLRSTISAQKAANTLLHEILHGIYLFQDITITSKEEDDSQREENICFEVANGLAVFFQDNRAIVDWMLHHLNVNNGQNSKLVRKRK